MSGLYSRRRVLRLCGVSAAVGLAGCSASSESASCDLHHEVSEYDDAEEFSGDEIAYENLSTEGKAVFDEARDSGSHVVSYDGDNKPPDFSYSDETTRYVVAYDGDFYDLLTYTGEGCVIE